MSATTPLTLAQAISLLAARRIELPTAADAGPLSADQALATARALGEISTAALELQAQAVQAARAAGASWARIGADLGTSRQAAQQRFGTSAPYADGDTRVLTPDRQAEREVLDDAGARGWRLREITGGAFILERRPGTWEVRRASLFGLRMPSESAGWEAVGTRFPDAFYVRQRR